MIMKNKYYMFSFKKYPFYFFSYKVWLHYSFQNSKIFYRFTHVHALVRLTASI